MARNARDGAVSDGEFMRDLECPVCLELCRPPIIQCVNGHMICGRCHPRLTRCPVCKGMFSKVRNLFAEQVVARLKYPCKFASNGCKEKIALNDEDRHLSVCTFVIRCQLKVPDGVKPTWYIPCLWLGGRSDLAAHMKTKHAGIMQNHNPKHVNSFELRHGVNVVLISFDQQYFWSVLQYNFSLSMMEGKMFLIGTTEKAKQYEYAYELCSVDRKFQSFARGDVLSATSYKNRLDEYFVKVDRSAVDKPTQDIVVQGKQQVARFIGKTGFEWKCAIFLKPK